MNILFLLLACGSSRYIRPVDADADADMAERLDRFTGWWLEPAELAPPVVAEGRLAGEGGGVRVTAELIRPETARWNTWGSSSPRLFNDRVAFVFEVTVDSDTPSRWLPALTTLEVNRPGSPITATRDADTLLGPLLAAAIEQERAGLPSDLVDRTRATAPFRDGYLDARAAALHRTGLIAFRRPDEAEHVVGVRLTIAVEADMQTRTLPLTFD